MNKLLEIYRKELYAILQQLQQLQMQLQDNNDD